MKVRFSDLLSGIGANRNKGYFDNFLLLLTLAFNNRSTLAENNEG